MAEIDLSGQSPAQSPQPSNLPPTSTPRGDSDPDILLRRDVHDAFDCVEHSFAYCNFVFSSWFVLCS